MPAEVTAATRTNVFVPSVSPVITLGDADEYVEVVLVSISVQVTASILV